MYVKSANCLIKNLFEMDTLPHLKIYSKLPVGKQGNRSVLPKEMEGRNEVNDGRKACLDQKLCPPLPEERQEGEGGSADGVYPDDGLQPLLWSLPASPPGQACLAEPQRVAVGDIGKRVRRERARKYDQKVVEALKIIWKILDYLCGKRLAAILPEVVPILQRHGELKVDASTTERLIQISAATIDRLLAPERRKHQLKGRSGTKPGTLLKHQIPIKRFADWQEDRPGFVEVDLVGHEGGQGRGDYCQTLDVTDAYTGWTEIRAVRNKAQVWVLEAMKLLRQRSPFPWLGMASDNGSEFINKHLLRFCEQEKITFSRTRPSRKNDNPYVEQKNYSVVRRAVGYARYEGERELELVNELYDRLRLQINFFKPVMKMVAKQRRGSRIWKKYDVPKTPYRRICESPEVAGKIKRQLAREYEKLNPAQLARQIGWLQNCLLLKLTPEQKKRWEAGWR